MDKVYPIGTKIKYIGNCARCKDKMGTIVGVNERTCIITLPLSTCGVFHYNGEMTCSWCAIEPVLVKNQQLLFAFMEQENDRNK